MNIWKITTLGLVAVLAAVVGTKGTPNVAQADLQYDWAKQQPLMQRALNDLAGARNSLEAAEENKGGWRAIALKHTDEALFEVKRGMEYAKAHGN